MLGVANRLVKASLAICRSNHIPKADTTNRQLDEAIVVTHPLEVFADRTTKQAPELICRMRIIARRSKRRVTWKAAEQKETDIAANNGRQTGFDGQE